MAECRTLCHGRACTTGPEVRPTEVEMHGANEKYSTLVFLSSTQLPSAALLELHMVTRSLLCLDSGAVARAGQPPA